MNAVCVCNRGLIEVPALSGRVIYCLCQAGRWVEKRNLELAEKYRNIRAQEKEKAAAKAVDEAWEKNR